MKLAVDPRHADAWAHRILAYESAPEYRQLLDELAASPTKAQELLAGLAQFRDPVVRAWAGSAAKEVFGREAVPLLTRLLKDRDPDVRDGARQDLVELDPGFESTFFPDYRRALRGRKDPWGEDRSAMFHLARARDPEAVALLRDYASHYESRYWHNRMPLVLADYIEDPTSVMRRIRNHDHEFMFWLVLATVVLDIADAQVGLVEALDRPIDEACAAIIRGRLQHGRRESSSSDIREH